MRLVPFLSAATMALSIAGCPSSGPGPNGPDKGKASTSDATDFTLNDIDGKQVSLSQYLGKGVIVLSFWATWCKPCMNELAHLQKLYDEKKGQGLVVLAISVDRSETEADVAPTVKKKGWTFPVLLDSESRATSLYNPRGNPPYMVLIDKKGKIIKQREGFEAGDEKQLDADVDAALK